jgi:putative flippase GtrA
MVTIPYGDAMRLVRLRLVPRSLTGRWRNLLQEVSKFGAIGVVNLVVNYAVFNLLVLTVFVDGQLKANVAATVVATTNSYFMNRHWTFRNRPKSALHREYALFFLFNIAGLMIELGVLAVAKYGLGITTLVALNVAKGFATCLGMVFRFWAYRTVVFRKAPTPTVEEPPSAKRVYAADSHSIYGAGPVASEFDDLTGPLERELDPPLDSAIQAELEAADAEFTANRTTQH